MPSNESSPSSFHRSVNFAVLLSVLAFVAMALSMPVLFTIMNTIDEELEQSRIIYDEMTNLMWKDLINEGDHARKVRSQQYNVSAAPTQLYEANFAPGYVDQGVLSSAADMGQLCPVGPKGPRGPKGIAGNNGIDGINGIPGKSSAVGFELDAYGAGACAPCPAGPSGLPGYKGIRGFRGPKGNKGTPGHPGNDGSIGEPGQEGNPGLPGPAGAPGERGAPGEDRVESMKGAPGPRGEMGLPGMPGDEGLPGERGEDMKPGPPGPPGPMGPTGEPGPDGPAGHKGGIGEDGSDAEYCPCPDRSKGGFAGGAAPVSAAIGRAGDGTGVSDEYKKPESGISIKGETSILDTNGSARMPSPGPSGVYRARPSSVTSVESAASIGKGPISTPYGEAPSGAGVPQPAASDVYQANRDGRARFDKQALARSLRKRLLLV